MALDKENPTRLPLFGVIRKNVKNHCTAPVKRKNGRFLKTKKGEKAVENYFAYARIRGC